MTSVSEAQAAILAQAGTLSPDERTIVAVDEPAVVAEVAAAFRRYEQALMSGDLEVLAELFWAGDATRRFGVADAQRGPEALRRWRADQPPLPAGRDLFDTQVTTFDRGCASVTTCFRYPGRRMIGRQSQMWVRFPHGWRIVSAHVSEIAEPGEGPEPSG